MPACPSLLVPPLAIPALALLAILFAGDAEARSAHKAKPLIPGIEVEAELETHGRYANKSGESVHAPARGIAGLVPEGATARCGDGTYSFSHSRTGTCSRHGGVGGWLR